MDRVRESLLPDAPGTAMYPDRGCPGGGRSCLRCRLAFCLHDERPRTPAEDLDRRDAESVWLFQQGLTVGAVAARQNISERTVQRALARHRRGELASWTIRPSDLPDLPGVRGLRYASALFSPSRPPRLFAAGGGNG